MMQNVQLMSGYRQPDQLSAVAVNQYGSNYGVMPGGYTRGPGGYHQMGAYNQVLVYTVRLFMLVLYSNVGDDLPDQQNE